MKTCEVVVPQSLNAKEPELTIGQIFLLRCFGNFSLPESSGQNLQNSIQPSPQDSSTFQTDASKSPSLHASLVLPEGMSSRALKLHSVEAQSDTELVLRVYSHQVGPQTIPVLKFVDASGGERLLGEVGFTIKSVIENPQQQPYGLLGPLVLPLNWGWVVIFSVVFLAWGSWHFFLRRKERRWKELQAFLESLRTPLSPKAQLLEDLRKQLRSLLVQDSLRSIHVYLQRHFEVQDLSEVIWTSTFRSLSDLEKTWIKKVISDLETFRKNPQLELSKDTWEAWMQQLIRGESKWP